MEDRPWMIAVLMRGELKGEQLRRLLGDSADLREGKHGLPIRPSLSLLCHCCQTTIQVDHFRERWRDSPGENLDPDSPAYSDQQVSERLIGDPWCLKRAIEQHHGEASAILAAERHEEYVLFRVPPQPGAGRIQSFIALLDLAERFLSEIRGAVLFNPRAEVLRSAEDVRAIRQRSSANGIPPVELLINARSFVLPGGWALADSVGLAQLELPDQEVAFNQPVLGVGDALEFVKGLASHLIAHRTPINNGDTAGGPRGTVWEAMLLGRAAIAPHRKIIRWLPEDREGMPPTLEVP